LVLLNRVSLEVAGMVLALGIRTAEGRRREAFLDTAGTGIDETLRGGDTRMAGAIHGVDLIDEIEGMLGWASIWFLTSFGVVELTVVSPISSPEIGLVSLENLSRGSVIGRL
jgi:hypothetical protein